MKKNLVKCLQIAVDCVLNDSANLNCGEPEYFGFDFYVREENANSMVNFIIQTLKFYDVPLVRIYSSNRLVLNETEVWGKERIVDTISREASNLISEAKKNTNFSYKR